jgi:hypothetical protein
MSASEAKSFNSVSYSAAPTADSTGIEKLYSSLMQSQNKQHRLSSDIFFGERPETEQVMQN